MENLIYFFVFIFGTIIGSFLNVVIARYNTGESVFKGRSKCFSCGKTLAWYELVPVFSFLLQGGKCRECGSKISIQYPVVEILTGIIFVLVWYTSTWRLSLQVEGELVFFAIYFWTIFSLLIVIAVYDFYHQIIPDGLVYAFITLSFLSFLPIGETYVLHRSHLWDFLAGIIFFLFFASFWFFSGGKWMGFGDAKLAIGIGWLLGLWVGLASIILSFWIGAIVGLVFIFSKKLGLKSKIAFGPFLILGTFIGFLLGERLLEFIFFLR
ncbi:MAG: prepilin peptidase [Parcubacteria group bacterium CG10_big_fil_rev_8_21_14_0_10_38_31]|nr:MAG: prepilin peptidase [Parcubacteria group bacterium CG10_big_fil_rev_8_21_14_0_10_38_31]